MCITWFGAGALAALPGEGSLLLPLSEHEVNPDIEQQGHHEGEVEGHQRGVDDETRVGYGTDTGIPWGGKEREREERLSCFGLVQEHSGVLAKQDKRWLGTKAV